MGVVRLGEDHIASSVRWVVRTQGTEGGSWASEEMVVRVKSGSIP